MPPGGWALLELTDELSATAFCYCHSLLSFERKMFVICYTVSFVINTSNCCSTYKRRSRTNISFLIHSRLACSRLLETRAKERARGRKRGGWALPHSPLVFVPSLSFAPLSRSLEQAIHGTLTGTMLCLGDQDQIFYAP